MGSLVLHHHATSNLCLLPTRTRPAPVPRPGRQLPGDRVIPDRLVSLSDPGARPDPPRLQRPRDPEPLGDQPGAPVAARTRSATPIVTVVCRGLQHIEAVHERLVAAWRPIGGKMTSRDSAGAVTSRRAAIASFDRNGVASVSDRHSAKNGGPSWAPRRSPCMCRTLTSPRFPPARPISCRSATRTARRSSSISPRRTTVT